MSSKTAVRVLQYVYILKQSHAKRDGRQVREEHDMFLKSYQWVGSAVLAGAGKLISQLGSQKKDESRLGGVMDWLLRRESYTLCKSKVMATKLCCSHLAHNSF